MSKQPPAKQREDRSSPRWRSLLTVTRRVILLGGFVLAGFAVTNWLNVAAAETDCGDKGLVPAIDVIAATPELVDAPDILTDIRGAATRLLFHAEPRVTKPAGALPGILDQACRTVFEAVSQPISGAVFSTGTAWPVEHAGQHVGSITNLLGEFVLGERPPPEDDISAFTASSPVPTADSSESIVDDRLEQPALATSASTVTIRPGLAGLTIGAVETREEVPSLASDITQPQAPFDGMPRDYAPSGLAASGAGTTSLGGGGGGPVLGAVLPDSVTPGWPLAAHGVFLDEVWPIRQVAHDPAVSPD